MKIELPGPKIFLDYQSETLQMGWRTCYFRNFNKHNTRDKNQMQNVQEPSSSRTSKLAQLYQRRKKLLAFNKNRT